MRALSAREDHVRLARRCSSRQQAHCDALGSHEWPTGAPVCSPTPIAPEQRSSTHREGMPPHARLARLHRGVAMPLARLTQAAIGFSALLMRDQFLRSRTTPRPIGLGHHILAREATCVPGPGSLRGLRARGGRRRRWGRGEMVGAHAVVRTGSGGSGCPSPRRRGETPGETTCQASGPAGRGSAPAIGVKRFVFSGEHGFTGPTMPRPRNHSRGGEAVWREGGEKAFGDHALADQPDASLVRGSRVGGHHDTTAGAILAHRPIRAAARAPSGDPAPCRPCPASPQGNRPDRRAPPQFRSVHRTEAGHGLATGHAP